jgi:hypothetical protein
MMNFSIQKAGEVYQIGAKPVTGSTQRKRDGGRMNLKQFLKDRDEALLSLDEQKIRAYSRKYRIPMPANEKAFWGGYTKPGSQSPGFRKRLNRLAESG